jgi:hypothetical protein
VDGSFDSDDNSEVHRRNLPHRRQAGVIYFVTFHLADSLPTKKLVALEKEKKIWLNLNPPPHNPRQIEEYHRNLSKRIQKWLDAGYGSCLLARPKIFHLVESVLNFFNGQRYALGQYVVMPNHVHAWCSRLMTILSENILHSEVVFANQINKISGQRGRVLASGTLITLSRSPAFNWAHRGIHSNNPVLAHGKRATKRVSHPRLPKANGNIARQLWPSVPSLKCSFTWPTGSRQASRKPNLGADCIEPGGAEDFFLPAVITDCPGKHHSMVRTEHRLEAYATQSVGRPSRCTAEPPDV